MGFPMAQMQQPQPSQQQLDLSKTPTVAAGAAAAEAYLERDLKAYSVVLGVCLNAGSQQSGLVAFALIQLTAFSVAPLTA
jgi:hypothetical protein